MSDPSITTGPGARQGLYADAETLPLPPTSSRPSPDGSDPAEELADVSWAVWDGAASRTSVWRIFGRLPAIARRVLHMAWRADISATLMVIILQMASAVIAAFGLLASVRVLQAFFDEGATPDRVRAALPSLALVAVLLMVRALLDTGVALYQARLTPKIRRAVEVEFLYLAAHVRLEAVDDADWADHSSRANERGLQYTRHLITQIIELVSAMLGLASAASVLAVLHPLLLPLLLASVIPQGFAAMRSARMRFLSQVRYTTLQRRIRVLTWLLVDRTSAAELRSLTAQSALLGEHERIAKRIEAEDTTLARTEARTGLAGRALGGLATGLTYTALAWMAMTGWLPLEVGGGVVLAIRMSQSALSRIVISVHYVYEHALWVDDLLNFLDRCRLLLPRCTGQSLPADVKSITVENVEYRYPETQKPALHGVSMTLRAGSTVAFVGANGSGKSTMAKLLAGLYEPTAGTIRWDDIYFNEVDAESVQSRVAMVLQNPVEWPLTALANITISSGTITEAEPNKAREVAKASGADRLIYSLPRQWATPLSKRFKGGQELSGGNWAKFAVARGLYKDAPVLLLDEPTANLDPRAEHAIYASVLHRHHRADRITILISHRLATVIECDEIFVFQEGRIIEAGNHASLMAQGGEYAAMFSLQADAYLTNRHVKTDTGDHTGEK